MSDASLAGGSLKMTKALLFAALLTVSARLCPPCRHTIPLVGAIKKRIDFRSKCSIDAPAPVLDHSAAAVCRGLAILNFMPVFLMKYFKLTHQSISTVSYGADTMVR